MDTEIIAFLAGVLFTLLCIPIFLKVHRYWRRRRKGRLSTTLYFKTFKIKGVNMSITVKKSQFLFDPATPDVLFILGHLAPTDDNKAARGLLAGSVEYSGDNDAAATIAADPADQNKFKIVWVAPGNVTFASKAKSDPSENVLVDSLDLVLVDDSLPPPPPPATEATQLNMQLDLTAA